MKVVVHSFKWYDVNRNQTFFPDVKRTEEWIRRTQGAEIIPRTAEVIDDSQLDPHGAYDPRSRGRHRA